MHFTALFLLVAVASAAFSFAAPVTPATTALKARECDCHDIHSFIVDVIASLTPLIQELNTPIISDIKHILSIAISDVNGPVGVALTTVLTTVDGVLTVADVAQLVCSLLNLPKFELCGIRQIGNWIAMTAGHHTELRACREALVAHYHYYIQEGICNRIDCPRPV
ncbi:hypothetical protein GYMLUDRAFT_65269 [Collybiopsis luxurians FD-317 M1]|uniref:Uncharacterized protein n=1 Tax=Collybiopsis luxurians FD-317 M1 TaxID=944289 RepID=A0A0D0B8I2_9AGAR|nr:hypothetical protein GYMLUDRAFT_65269 [Collybiopsis luxurians FD-317 M1]